MSGNECDEIEQKLIFFMHIPKTGGVTLRKIIEKEYNSDEIFEGDQQTALNKAKQMTKTEEEKLKCIYGHVHFGIHRHFSQNATYITMLRDPVERIISLYYFLLRRPNGILYEKVKDLTLREFVKNKELWSQTFNQQTRIAMGENFFDFKSPGAKLAKAKENLDTHFAVVGVTEMFDKSLFLIKKKLGWDDVRYVKKNVSKNRPTKEEVSKEITRPIKEINELDIKLYNYVKKNLKQQIEKLDKKTKQELNSFIPEVSSRVE